MSNPYRIHLHGTDGAWDYYRATLPAKYCTKPLAARGVELVHSDTLDAANPVDCYVFRRSLSPKFIPYLHTLKFKHKCKIVWDMDDDLFSVPEWSPAHAGASDHHVRAAMALALDWADRVTVTTDRLGVQACGPRGWLDKTTVLPNLIDPEAWDFPSERREGPARVLWAGSITHAADLDLIVPAVHELLYRHNIHFYFMGQSPPSLPPTLRGVTRLGATTLHDYPHAVRAVLPDVALLPLVDHPINNAKSNIKYLEMTMAGAACVASPVGPYLDTVPRKWLCDAPDEWADAVGSLARNACDRAMSVIDSRKIVESKYSWKCPRADMWTEFFASLAE